MSSPVPPPLDPHIRTARLVLRAPIPSDAAALSALFSDPLSTQFEPHKPRDPTAAHYRQQITTWDGKRRRREACFLVIALADDSAKADAEEVIGIGGINGITKDGDAGDVADVGVLIASARWRTGYGREAMEAVVEFAFGEAGCEEVLCETMAVNEPFRALADSLGLREFGKLSGDGSECVYRFSKADWYKVKKRRDDH